MKTLLAAALVLSASSQDETSLMQGLARRVDGKLGADPTANTKRPDAMSQLMETATTMLKNGAGVTPDVVAFIDETINEITVNVLGDITRAHDQDTQDLAVQHAQFQVLLDEYAARIDGIDAEMTAFLESSRLHKACRSVESHKCGLSRKCEEELIVKWRDVKREEQIMREIHGHIHEEWCITRTEGQPWDAIGDPWGWTDETQPEGAETSQTITHYPIIDYENPIRVVRAWSVTKFREYSAQIIVVERAWELYNAKLLECATLEDDLPIQTLQCDELQDTLQADSCSAAADTRDARKAFGEAWHIRLENYYVLWDAVQLKVQDRMREWETIKIVDCLLQTVHSHVIHSIDSGEPCPTIESHPAQTESEINQCHVISYVDTANLTICSDGAYERPTRGAIATQDYEHVASDGSVMVVTGQCHDEPNTHDAGNCHWAHPLAQWDSHGSTYLPIHDFHMSEQCAPPPVPDFRFFVEHACSTEYVWETQGHFSDELAAQHAAAAIYGDFDTSLSPAGWAGCAAPKVCVGCSGYEVTVNEDYLAMSQTCRVHEEHLLLGEMDRDNFRCLDTGCIPASARCNGHDNCQDGSDELGCDSIFETPASLSQHRVCEAHAVPGQQTDVNFACSTGQQCIPVEGRCNGHNNCDDGSDEQGCAVGIVGVTLEASSGRQATLETMIDGAAVFHDRQYIFDSLGSFTNMHFVKTHNDDKFTATDKVQMKVRLPQPMTLYITHSHDQVLPWLSILGWTEVPAFTGVGYSGSRMTRHKEWSGQLETDFYTAGPVWEKSFPAGLVSLPGNGHNDGQYLTFVGHPSQVPDPGLPAPHPQPQPSPAFFTGDWVGGRNNYNGDVGLDFRANQHLTITHLGRGANNGHLSEAKLVTLWSTTTQQAIAQIAVGPTSDFEGNYAYSTLPAPVILEAGQEYRISQRCVSGMPDYWYDASDATENLDEYATFIGGVYRPGFSYPSRNDGAFRRSGMLNFKIGSAVAGPQCSPAQNSVVDEGYSDAFRGWYDVQGCGACNDYCRWVGNSGSGGSPSNLAHGTGSNPSWWSCRLAGSSEPYSPREHFTSFSFPKCSGQR